MTPKEFARELVFAAKKKMRKSSSCYPPGGAPPIVTDRSSGWSFTMDVYEHPASTLLLSHPPQTIPIHHYGFSAKLFPPGRSSTEEDWKKLGEFVSEIVRATGYPDNLPMPEPLLPIEGVHPNSAIHWMWHDDGSDVDINVRNMTAEALAMVQKQQIELARSQGLAEKHGRNDPCPCGSGKKWKKCHGAPN